MDIVWGGDRLVVAGPATRPIVTGVGAGVPVFGVRFRLGAAGAALGLAASELVDQSIPLADLWGDTVDRGGFEGGVSRLVELVRSRLAAPPDPVVRRAALALARPGVRVETLDLGVSERQLRRRFADAVGYGPKRLARVLRFQRFLGLAEHGGDLARLALDAGYADQAHLTRDCRELAGRTPAELMRSGAGPAGERLVLAR